MTLKQLVGVVVVGLLLTEALSPLAVADHGETLLVSSKGLGYVVTENEDGTLKMVPATDHFDMVVVLGRPQPGPGPGPQPAPLTERGLAVRDAAAKAVGDKKREETAVMLALMYGEVRKRIGTGEITGPVTIATICGMGADEVLKRQGPEAAAAWKPFRDLLKEQWNRESQERNTDAGYAKLLEEVSAGLEASVPKSGAAAKAIDREAIIKIIIEIILLILDRIQP